MLNQTMSSLDVVRAAPGAIAKTHQRMIDAQPPYYRDSPQMNAVIGGQAAEIEQRRAEARDLLDQMTISKATWSLEMYETIFDVKYNPSKTIKERQDVIRAKMRGAAPTTLAVLKSVVNAFVANQNADVTLDNPNYTIYAEMPELKRANIGALISAVNEVKPAHMAFIVTDLTRGNIEVSAKAYDFGVYYPVCNTFQTADMRGKMSRNNIAPTIKTYSFGAELPICGEFVTAATVNIDASAEIETTEITRAVVVAYPRAGETYTTEEEN